MFGLNISKDINRKTASHDFVYFFWFENEVGWFRICHILEAPKVLRVTLTFKLGSPAKPISLPRFSSQVVRRKVQNLGFGLSGSCLMTLHPYTVVSYFCPEYMFGIFSIACCIRSCSFSFMLTYIYIYIIIYIYKVFRLKHCTLQYLGTCTWCA